MLYIILTKTITKTKKSSEYTIMKTKTKLHFLLKLILILKLFHHQNNTATVMTIKLSSILHILVILQQGIVIVLNISTNCIFVYIFGEHMTDLVPFYFFNLILTF